VRSVDGGASCHGPVRRGSGIRDQGSGIRGQGSGVRRIRVLQAGAEFERGLQGGWSIGVVRISFILFRLRTRMHCAWCIVPGEGVGGVVEGGRGGAKIWRRQSMKMSGDPRGFLKPWVSGRNTRSLVPFYAGGWEFYARGVFFPGPQRRGTGGTPNWIQTTLRPGPAAWGRHEKNSPKYDYASPHLRHLPVLDGRRQATPGSWASRKYGDVDGFAPPLRGCRSHFAANPGLRSLARTCPGLTSLAPTGPGLSWASIVGPYGAGSRRFTAYWEVTLR
jgi:hypothetical protein